MPQSQSSYTIISFPVKPTEFYLETGYDVLGYYGIPNGSQLDFQVEALVGHPSQRWVSLYPIPGGEYVPAVAYDKSSNWSNTQTVAIPESNSSPTPIVPEFTIQLILPLFTALPLIAIIVLRRKKS